MIDLEPVSTTGLRGLANELLRETHDDALSPLARGAEEMAERMRSELGRSGGPARPGDPPAKVRGALQDSVGRTAPFDDGDGLAVLVGIGVGDEAQAKVDSWLGRGVEVLAYAALHERGGFGADGRRYPPRAFARVAEEASEATFDSELARAFR